MPILTDPSNGETRFAAKQRAELLRQALLSLSDQEIHVITLRFNGMTVRTTGVHIGHSHVEVLRIQRRAMGKLRTFFAERGVFELTDIL